MPTERCFSIADFEHICFALLQMTIDKTKASIMWTPLRGFDKKGEKKHLRQQTEFYSCEESHSSNITSGTPEMQRAGILLKSSIHKISAPHNKPLKCPYYIMYYDFKSADISGCCTLISKPNGLFRPSNSCSSWLWSSWWIRSTSISSKSVFFSVFNPRSKFPEKLVWIFRANGVTFFLMSQVDCFSLSAFCRWAHSLLWRRR